MSTATLENLRDYLYGTLTPDNMYWLAEELMEQAKKEKEQLRPYTKVEINAMLDQAETDFAAGLGIPDEEAWDELDSKDKAQKIAEAV